MSTSESQVIARALYDALIGGALQSLRAAAAKMEPTNGTGADFESRVLAGLPADAPREVRNFLIALAREGAIEQLPGVVQAFEHYSRGEQQALTGEVISAFKLDEAQRTRITHELRQRYGDRLELRFQEDPSLIGGLIIRVGDRVLDNSLRTRLSAIQRNMLTS